MNNPSLARQAASLTLAALATLSMLSGINGLAVSPAPDSLLAAHSAPAQVVVIEAQRSDPA
jgi:hypothetical protein